MNSNTHATKCPDPSLFGRSLVRPTVVGLRVRFLSPRLRAFCGVLLLGVGLVSCHSGGGPTEPHLVKMAEMSKDILLPTKIWDEVTGDSFESSIKHNTSFLFAPIVVILEEKTPGVLTEPKIRMEFPQAGGEVDFSKYVKGDRGTFRINFDFDGFAEPEFLQVFYVPRVHHAHFGSEKYGSGCTQYFDVKDYLVKVNSKDGLVVNVTQGRHDLAVGGHFLFSYKKKEQQTRISQVTFTDSKRPNLFCDASEK